MGKEERMEEVETNERKERLSYVTYPFKFLF